MHLFGWGLESSRAVVSVKRHLAKRVTYARSIVQFRHEQRPAAFAFAPSLFSGAGHNHVAHRVWSRSLWGGRPPTIAPPREARVPIPRGQDLPAPAAPVLTWVDSVPTQYQPYLRLARADKPIGTWLLLWPCCWSIAIVAPVSHLPDVWMLSKFALGAVVMRGAGCTINDMWDKDIDSKVERTKMRPLASGAVTRFQAAGFLGLQLTVGLGVLTSLNTYSILLGASSMGLVVLYPLMKRVTNFPQLVLGLTFNWGALLGASAVVGYTPIEVCLPLYLGSVCWTLTYDTIYAHQDRADDIKVGVKSTALYLGDMTKPVCAAWSALFAGGLVAAGQAAGMGMIFHGAVGFAVSHLAWQIVTVNLNRPADCMAKFVSNKWLGAILFFGIVADKYFVVTPDMLAGFF